MQTFDWRAVPARMYLDAEGHPLMLLHDGSVMSPLTGKSMKPPLPRMVLHAPDISAEEFGELVEEFCVAEALRGSGREGRQTGV